MANICVVIPAYKVSKQICQLVDDIGAEVTSILVVDDACPEGSGHLLLNHSSDDRVEVLFHSFNKGVGGAVKTGYTRAIELGADVVVKIDGDGQMDPSRLLTLIKPILFDGSDYAKGNRFSRVELLHTMPFKRVFGNLVLSFMSKLSTGYWKTFDPNNGYTAIKSDALQKLPLDKVDDRYFFESDMLFRLNLIGAYVSDVSMPSVYKEEVSNLKIRRVILEFPLKHARNFFKRVCYSYYLRDFTLASIELPLGLGLVFFGIFVGMQNWILSLRTGIPTTAGTAVLVAMSVLSGLQFVLAFFSYDIASTPTNRSSRREIN
jgi:dolichol-phosphate mannosyltransferase